jgi:hypothetical protein
MYSCAAKAPFATGRFVKDVNDVPGYVFMLGNNKLCNAHAVLDDEWFCADIGHDDLDLATIITVDRSRCIQGEDAVFGG